MRLVRAIWLGVALGLAGCAAPLPQADPAPAALPGDQRLAPREAARNFVTVLDRVEPVAEDACRALRDPGTDCDLQIVVVPDFTAPPNAFQTVDDAGRPVVAFTIALVADARNMDELAFILGHEAAHHIAGHLPRSAETARAGAMAGVMAARVIGADQGLTEELARIGASVSARSYSKEFELEADRLGTEIAWAAGYDPLIGARFFDRLPDPGDRFLGSHPANAQRQAQIAAVVAALEARQTAAMGAATPLRAAGG